MAIIKNASIEDGDARLRSYLYTLDRELHALQHIDRPAGQYGAIDRLRVRAAKRCNITNSELEQSTFTDFLRVNELAGRTIVKLDEDVARDARDFIEHALASYTATVNSSNQQLPRSVRNRKVFIKRNVQEVLDLDHLFDLWKFGPGASRGCGFKTHFADKVSCKSITVTIDALLPAKLLRLKDDQLRLFDKGYGSNFKVVKGNSLSCVPKNQDTMRTIATEPLANMMLQLAAGIYITLALKGVGLDISTQQDINKFLAEFGSEFKDIATLDLKSASDLIVPELIRLLWPAVWYEMFMTIRSPVTNIPGIKEPVELNMMSTMGNGFTFPMMTLTLLAIVYATQSSRMSKRFYWDRSNTAVFGDDIIVPTEDYDALVKNLSDAGLLVNKDKSFASGDFRESCGGDYLNGYNVTPFYVESLRNDAEVYIAINKLLDWSSLHDCRLSKTFDLLIGFLDLPEKALLVPVYEDPFAGIRTKDCPRRYYKLAVNTDDLVRLRRINSKVRKGPPEEWSDSESYVTPADMKSIIGGYVTSRGNNHFCYTRRLPQGESPTYEVVQARLPRGRIDGRHHVIRGAVREEWVSTFVSWSMFAR